MIDAHEDQASGLRRLFRKSPPCVVALFATGHHAPANAALALHRLAGMDQRLLVLDEAAGERSLAATLGVAPGADLLHVLEGRTPLAGLVQPVVGLAGRLPVAATAMALPLLDDPRRALLLEALQTLQRRVSVLAVHADASAQEQPSPFVFAAPRRLLVVEASGRGATEAYNLIKQLAAAGAGSLQVAVTRARDRADATALFRRLDDLVRRHVGIPLAWLGEIERDEILQAVAEAGPPGPRAQESAFLRRLAGWGRQGQLPARQGRTPS